MLIVAVLAILVGALELLNTVGAATAVGRGGRSTASVMILVAAAIVAALLVGSGIALVVRRRRAIPFARLAALACLVVFAAIAALRPGLSIAATLLGIVFPIVMLVFLLRQSTEESNPARR
jgi:uncharacterized membrane protein YhaH (DUF805 family)